MTVKEFITAATDTVHVMVPHALHGTYHPRTKKTYISCMETDIDTANRTIDFFTTEMNEEMEEIVIMVYTR